MTSFDCKQCTQCKRYRNIQEEFNLGSVCNHCYIPKEEPPKKVRNVRTLSQCNSTRMSSNRSNPLAKKLFKDLYC